ncbi:CRISPR-associated helicase Cas3' [Paraburkholderia sp. UCT31]|uniref:CRISPR-associated helicase Cas3' n=1 Tax=Paraburkholderia sp. UCT31 TaxID=2615209 RepID=UPI0039747643
MDYLNFWGKAHPLPEARSVGADWHPLAYHSLDVAAVVGVFLETNPAVLRRLSILLALPESDTRHLSMFLAACHDVGKFGIPFQSKADEAFSVLFPGERRVVEGEPHSEVGLTTLLEFLAAHWMSSDEAEQSEAFLEPLANATCGHHGRPESLRVRPLKGLSGRAANAYLVEVARLFGQPALPWRELPDPQRLRDASWLLAGVVTLCDWVGSSQDFFPYQLPLQSLDDYLSDTLNRAEVAVSKCGLVEKPRSSRFGFDWLFGAARALCEPGYAAKSPTPLQDFVDTVALPSTPEPVLFVLEDETGAGKTEAALTLASRLMSNGFARGVFFSLPTQTTANAVFERVEPLVSRLFEPGHQPIVTLAHGQAKTALARMRASRAQPGTVSSELDSWAQESAKTALLSDVGVGTIDQVVMAGLPVRHVVLRHVGLAEKVLIVDEAHACEPYLLDILKNALTQHARLGGSAIILSATLPRTTKQALIKAFARGKGGPTPTPLLENAYPLATAFSGLAQLEKPIHAKGTPRTLSFERIGEADAIEKIGELLEAGRCVCLMRNTVGSAQAAYDLFAERYPGKVSLVHARFMLGDRGANDEALLRSFGKNSTQATRAGRLVIATQVAEQSLDVDFDEMFTDLAPVDSLLQRAGRRRRHPRDTQGNPAELDARAPSPLYVIMPASVDGERFLNDLPGGTVYVYPMPGVLLRTAQIVKDWQRLQIPSEVRRAVEYAYDERATVPSPMEGAEKRAQGRTSAAQQHARVSMLRLDCGYSTEAGIETSERSVTRLGEASVQVVLCDTAASPQPLFRSKRDGAVLSQISLRARLIGEPVQNDGRVYLRMSEVAQGTWRAQVRDARGKVFTARYSRERGFSLE